MTASGSSIASMTGFARAEGEHNGLAVQIEARCVNGRSSDIKLRLPSGWDDLDRPVRTVFQSVIRRGNATVSVSAQRESRKVPKVNLTALQALREDLGALTRETGEAPPPLGTLLQVPGVVEMVDPSAETDVDTTQRETFLLDLARRCADDLAQARLQEGAAMAAVVSDLFDQIESEVSALSALPETQGDHLQERFQQQLARLLDDGTELDPQRLHQELAILVTKADIAEELARLRAHIDAGRSLLRETNPVGRKLDFLAQEFNREANTICSKASALSITQHGLALKALIDQVKEQVQNIE